jgi:hypothetical protein
MTKAITKPKPKPKAKPKAKAKAKANPSSDFLKKWDKQQKEQKASARRSLRRFCQQLVKLEVDIVTINYDGYGDSGIVEDLVALQNGKPIELPRRLNDRLLDFAESYLPGGWENNDGACGTFVLNIQDRKFFREHCWRHTEYEHDEEEILL